MYIAYFTHVKIRIEVLDTQIVNLNSVIKIVPLFKELDKMYVKTTTTLKS